jgi:diguanylate cyclase (GGDEF)-like protein
MLYKWLSHFSVQKKIVLASTWVTFIALTPIIVVMLCYEYYVVQKATLEEIRNDTSILGDSAAAILAFGDKKSANELLATLHRSPNTVQATLLMPNGQVLAHYNKQGSQANSWVTQEAIKTGENITWSHIIIYQPVFIKTQYVGKLNLMMSLHSFHTRLAWYVFTTLMTGAIALFIAIRIAIRISKTITDPIFMLANSAEKFSINNDAVINLPADSHDEIGTLARAFKYMMTEIKSREMSLQQKAFYDQVTSLPNRHYFHDRIEASVEQANKYNVSCVLMLIDLDDFKIVNDQHGHDIGDFLLKAVGQRIRDSLRKMDMVFRIGGDEFAVILDNTNDPELIDRLARKIIRVVSTPFTINNLSINVGASIGISIAPGIANTMDSIIKTADKAMYQVKAMGKNRYQIYADTDIKINALSVSRTA